MIVFVSTHQETQVNLTIKQTMKVWQQVLQDLASGMEAGKSMDLKEAITQGGGQMLERVLGEAIVGIASVYWCW